VQTSFPNSFQFDGMGGANRGPAEPMNAPSLFPPVVSVVGSSLFCEGQSTKPTTVSPGVPLGLQGFGYGTQAKLLAFQQLLTFDNGLALVQASNGITNRGVNDANLLNAASASAPAVGDAIPSSSIGRQLQQVAKIIQVRAALGMSRQIFYCALNGFDTHGSHLAAQDALLADLSPAMAAFYNATLEMAWTSR